MNDRELLELAAKAVGLLYKQRTEVVDSCDNFIGIKIRNAWNDRYRLWNPLTDDGDALRLAVKLKLEVGVWFDTTRVESDEAESAVEKHLADPYAATRRAIVRAAAEIGKAMP